MNVFRRFEVDAEKMYAFYGDVLGLTQLSTIDLATGAGVARFQAGASELKFTRRVPDRSYVDGGPRDATGVRMITVYLRDVDAIKTRFEQHGLAAPRFASDVTSGALSAIVNDPDGQAVEIRVPVRAPASEYERIDVGLTVANVNRSRAFYRDFVGLEEQAPYFDHGFNTMVYPYRHGSTTINLRRFSGGLPADTGSGGIQYVVTDVEAVDQAAREHDISIDQPLSTITGFSVQTIWLDDPDGITNYFAETDASRAAQ